MKSIFIYVVLFVLPFGLNANGSDKTILSGKITDKQTKEPIVGATIYITDLKTGSVSDVEGNYIIDNLPKIKLLIQVRSIGYSTITETVDLSSITIKNFEMDIAVVEGHEVVITGLSQATERNRTPTPISVVSKTELFQNSSGNIIDAISKQPGISQVGTGPGISKPVIRGLGYNRVVVVNDGIRQEGQQWGDEHGIEIDEFSVNKVEILKGPASLTYGSDAMAGVINMVSAPTNPEGQIKGIFLLNYQTNNGLIGYSGNVSGNLKGFIWDARFSQKNAHAYKNKYDGYVYNSGFRETNFSGIFGINKSWGYSHLHISSYALIPGLVEGQRDSATGKFVKPYKINSTVLGDTTVSNNDLKSYTRGVPYQNVQHYKAVLNNSFILGKSKLAIIAGFQQNQRKEFGNAFDPENYGLFFLMNTLNYSVRYTFPEKKDWNISMGVNGMKQNSYNKGTEYLVPEYSLFDIGEFITAHKSIRKIDISGGVRYDNRFQKGSDLFLDSVGKKTESLVAKGQHRFAAFNSTFSGVSGSMGFSYQLSEKVYAKMNASKGYRAPNIGELAANGEHEGAGRYEIGDPKLKAENSLQVDAGLGVSTKHITAELDLFNNSIDNFIYLHKLSSVTGSDSVVDPSNPIPTFVFKQGNANLFGGEVTVDIHPHPLDWLHFENSFSMVNSVQKNATDSTKYLPFTPPARYISELKADVKKLGKRFKNAYTKVELEKYFNQDHFYSASRTETATKGYLLINAGLGTDILSRKSNTICMAMISVNNIMDVAYQSHLSRLKYLPENYTTGRMGVYNMGRNISFKVIVPLEFKK